MNPISRGVPFGRRLPLQGGPFSTPNHTQNHHFHHWTALIDLLWRGWSHIDARDCVASRRVVDRWRNLDYPTFRRMALAAIGQSACWTPEEKLQVLLNGL